MGGSHAGGLRPGVEPAGFRIRAFRDDDVEELAAAMTAASAADGLPWAVTPDIFRDDLILVTGVEPERDLMVAEVDGHPLGIAWLQVAKREDIWRLGHSGSVHPDVRGRGIGRALLRAIVARAGEKAAALPAGERRALSTDCDDAEARAVRLYRSEGYRPYRWFALMARDLESLPVAAPRTVPGIELRPVEPAHHRAIFDALEEAFQDHWGHREWTDDDFARMVSAPGNDHSLWRVAWAGDEVAGVCRNTIVPEDAAVTGVRQGWLDQIGVRRPWRGRGVASLLIAETVALYAARGLQRVMLGVDLDNPTGALGLYESHGFVVRSRATEWERALPGDPPLPDPVATGPGERDGRELLAGEADR